MLEKAEFALLWKVDVSWRVHSNIFAPMYLLPATGAYVACFVRHRPSWKTSKFLYVVRTQFFCYLEMFGENASFCETFIFSWNVWWAKTALSFITTVNHVACKGWERKVLCSVQLTDELGAVRHFAPNYKRILKKQSSVLVQLFGKHSMVSHILYLYWTLCWEMWRFQASGHLVLDIKHPSIIP